VGVWTDCRRWDHDLVDDNDDGEGDDDDAGDDDAVVSLLQHNEHQDNMPR
jgi:hypothetical protein